jgi:hypothetical protein
VKLEVDEMPTVMERTMEYIRSLLDGDLLVRGALATLVCLIGAMVLFFVKRRSQEPKSEHWHNTDGVLRRKAEVKQSKKMEQTKGKDSTAYVNCIHKQ